MSIEEIGIVMSLVLLAWLAWVAWDNLTNRR